MQSVTPLLSSSSGLWYGPPWGLRGEGEEQRHTRPPLSRLAAFPQLAFPAPLPCILAFLSWRALLCPGWRVAHTDSQRPLRAPIHLLPFSRHRPFCSWPCVVSLVSP